MLHFNRLPMKLDSSSDESSVQYEKTLACMGQQRFPRHYTAETIIIDDDETNSNVNQNGNILVEDWIKGSQVLGFIPDHPTSNYSATQSCYDYFPLNNQNRRTYARKPYEYYSSKPGQNTLKVNLKRRRKRTSFTTEQIVVLEGVFQRKPYITREERVAMMNRLQVSEKAIKIWFQNRRRVTDKKCQEYESDSPSSIDTTDSFSDRLILIETHIKENTDENGYVLLNDHMLSELASVIDECLSRDVSFCNSEFLSNSNSTVTENVIMYEPISPASSECNLSIMEL